MPLRGFLFGLAALASYTNLRHFQLLHLSLSLAGPLRQMFGYRGNYQLVDPVVLALVVRPVPFFEVARYS
jgi:hypothetical protein